MRVQIGALPAFGWPARPGKSLALLALLLAIPGAGSADPDPVAPASPLTPSTTSMAAESLVLAGVANTVGSRSTRWRTDLSIRNSGNEPVEARVFFLRAGTANDLQTALHHDYFLVTGETREIRNVLGADLGTTGAGALLVSASRSLFPNNPAAPMLSARQRTATPLLFGPGDIGSESDAAEPTEAARQVIPGVFHDGVGEKGRRGSVGAVNLSSTQGLKLRIEFLDDANEVLGTHEIYVPPLSAAQQAISIKVTNGTARFVRTDGTAPYVAYGTTVDNQTSATTFKYATPETGHPAAPHRISLPALLDRSPSE
jgi:hypothetical protein